jgi:hypothetical protein
MRDVYSSYKENDFGKVFRLLVKAYQPRCIVELGTLNGYSAVHMAKGIKDNHEHFGIPCHLDCYDLWDDYQYNHGDMADVQKLLEEEGVQDFVTLHKKDAYEVHKEYKRRSVYILHVDISNTGDTLNKIVEQWNDKLVHNGVILFEGGSVERDNIEWMVKYKMPPIREAINSNPIIDKFYVLGTHEQFPSLTVIYKKYDEEHMP